MNINRLFCLTATIIISTLLQSSCAKIIDGIRNHYDLDPYSKDRNTSYSLLGCKWNDVQFRQGDHRYLLNIETAIKWSIVTMDEEDYIIINAPMTWNGYYPSLGIYNLFLVFPYSDSIKLQDYHKTDYYSFVDIYADKGKGESIIVNGEEYRSICSPLSVSVSYEKTGDIIEGTFSAEGEEIEIKGKGVQKIIIDEGVFSLNRISDRFQSGYWTSDYSYEQWYSESHDNDTVLISLQ